MTSERLCPEHHLVLDTAQDLLHCPAGHELNTDSGKGYLDPWWVVDVELEESDEHWRIAIVTAARIRWENWTQDVMPTLSFRSPEGMTGAAAIRGTRAERKAEQQRRWREQKRAHRGRTHRVA